jgi:hypothetical protein
MRIDIVEWSAMIGPAIWTEGVGMAQEKPKLLDQLREAIRV